MESPVAKLRDRQPGTSLQCYTLICVGRGRIALIVSFCQPHAVSVRSGRSGHKPKKTRFSPVLHRAHEISDGVNRCHSECWWTERRCLSPTLQRLELYRWQNSSSRGLRRTSLLRRVRVSRLHSRTGRVKWFRSMNYRFSLDGAAKTETIWLWTIPASRANAP